MNFNRVIIKKERVLGINVDMVDRQTTRDLICKIIEGPSSKKAIHLVTAYSEFFLKAQHDKNFRQVLEGADLVVPDGLGPLAAIEYRRSLGPRDGVFERFGKGLKIGLRVLQGKVGEVVSELMLSCSSLIIAISELVTPSTSLSLIGTRLFGGIPWDTLPGKNTREEITLPERLRYGGRNCNAAKWRLDF